MKLAIAWFAIVTLMIGFPTRTRAAPVMTPHVAVDLVSQTQSVKPGAQVFVAVVLRADKGWHTYWRNPGDAGEATTVRWSLPPGWSAGEIVWPPPSRLPVGPIMNYGYEGEALLATPLRAPADAPAGGRAPIKARVDFLVCAEVCIPGGADLALDLPVARGPPAQDSLWGPRIARDLAAAPRAAGFEATFQRRGAMLDLAAAGPALRGLVAADAYFYPYDDKLIDHAKDQVIDRGASGFTLSLSANPSRTGPPPGVVAGVLEVGGQAFEVAAKAGPAPAGSSGLGPPPAKSAVHGSADDPPRILWAMVLAFAGGLILNLMPCVFPILSMKAASLAAGRADAGRARRNAIAFTSGVVALFLALAAILIAARAAGDAVGWGFQLQSPLVVGALALVMFAAGLNLSGLYEVGTSLQGVGSAWTARGEVMGSFLTGALAVVVAAPCTAPFMGPALGFALTQSPIAALAVFLALALGFAAPFALVSFSPGLRRLLPAPGAWMEGLKRILAFPLYATAAWLAWVLAQQTGPQGLARLFAALIMLAGAASLLGMAQRSDRRRAARMMALAGLAGAICVAVLAVGPFDTPRSAGGAGAATLPSEPFSPARLAQLRAEGRPVLVNFTAAWCVTCQVNERVAFSSPAVASAFRRTRTAYLIADWTDRDPVIARALAAQGRLGVPLYLLYGEGRGEPVTLPQILTPATISAALTRDLRPAAPAAR